MRDPAGIARSLGAPVRDIGPEEISPAGLRRLAAIDPSSLPAVPGSPRLGPPCMGTRKFIAIGLNYAHHAGGAKAPLSAEPLVFLKAVRCLQGPRHDVVVPRDSPKTRLEGRLGVV